MIKYVDANGQPLLVDEHCVTVELDELAEKLFISAFGDPNFDSGWTSSAAEFAYNTAQKFLDYRESRKQK